MRHDHESNTEYQLRQIDSVVERQERRRRPGGDKIESAHKRHMKWLREQIRIVEVMETAGMDAVQIGNSMGQIERVWNADNER